MVLRAQSSPTVVGSEGLASPEAAAMALTRKRGQAKGGDMGETRGGGVPRPVPGQREEPELRAHR